MQVTGVRTGGGAHRVGGAGRAVAPVNGHGLPPGLEVMHVGGSAAPHLFLIQPPDIPGGGVGGVVDLFETRPVGAVGERQGDGAFPDGAGFVVGGPDQGAGPALSEVVPAGLVAVGVIGQALRAHLRHRMGAGGRAGGAGRPVDVVAGTDVGLVGEVAQGIVAVAAGDRRRDAVTEPALRQPVAVVIAEGLGIRGRVDAVGPGLGGAPGQVAQGVERILEVLHVVDPHRRQAGAAAEGVRQPGRRIVVPVGGDAVAGHGAGQLPGGIDRLGLPVQVRRLPKPS